MGTYTQYFGVLDDKRLYKPAIGERNWGGLNNQNLQIIADELSDLSQIGVDRLSQEVMDSLSFAIRGHVTYFSQLPDPNTFNVGDMYVVEDDEGPNQRGIYKVSNTGSPNAWEFFVSLAPLTYSFKQLSDAFPSFTGLDGRAIVIDEANNRLISAELASMFNLQMEISARTLGDANIITTQTYNFSNLTNPTSNASLKLLIDAETANRISNDGLLNLRILPLEAYKISSNLSILNHEARINVLETEVAPDGENFFRWVIDSFVSEDLVFGVGHAPSQFGYSEGSRVAINEPTGSVHNGNVYVCSAIDTWVLIDDRFHGLGVYLNNNGRIYCYSSDDQLGQWVDLLQLASTLYAPNRDYPLRWIVEDFISDGTFIDVAPSVNGFITNGAQYAVRHIGNNHQGEVYRVDTATDSWLLLDALMFGLGVYDKTTQLIYSFNGALISDDWRVANIKDLFEYKCGWDASGGTYPPNPETADYWKITTAGTIGGVDYAIGDAIIFNGISWDKIDNTEPFQTFQELYNYEGMPHNLDVIDGWNIDGKGGSPIYLSNIAMPSGIGSRLTASNGGLSMQFRPTNTDSNIITIDSNGIEIETLTSGDNISINSSNLLLFKDQFLTIPVPLSETGEIALETTAQSIIGAINEINANAFVPTWQQIYNSDPARAFTIPDAGEFNILFNANPTVGRIAFGGGVGNQYIEINKNSDLWMGYNDNLNVKQHYIQFNILDSLKIYTGSVLGQTQHIDIRSSKGLYLKDQYLTNPVSLSETGNTQLNTTAQSIIGAINEVITLPHPVPTWQQIYDNDPSNTFSANIFSFTANDFTINTFIPVLKINSLVTELRFSSFFTQRLYMDDYGIIIQDNSTNHDIKIEAYRDVQIRSANTGEITFDDSRTTAPIALTDVANPALLTTNQTLVGAINEVRSQAIGIPTWTQIYNNDPSHTITANSSFVIDSDNALNQGVYIYGRNSANGSFAFFQESELTIKHIAGANEKRITFDANGILLFSNGLSRPINIYSGADNIKFRTQYNTGYISFNESGQASPATTRQSVIGAINEIHDATRRSVSIRLSNEGGTGLVESDDDTLPVTGVGGFRFPTGAGGRSKCNIPSPKDIKTSLGIKVTARIYSCNGGNTGTFRMSIGGFSNTDNMRGLNVQGTYTDVDVPPSGVLTECTHTIPAGWTARDNFSFGIEKMTSTTAFIVVHWVFTYNI